MVRILGGRRRISGPWEPRRGGVGHPRAAQRTGALRHGVNGAASPVPFVASTIVHALILDVLTSGGLVEALATPFGNRVYGAFGDVLLFSVGAANFAVDVDAVEPPANRDRLVPWIARDYPRIRVAASVVPRHRVRIAREKGIGLAPGQLFQDVATRPARRHAYGDELLLDRQAFRGNDLADGSGTASKAV